MSAVPPPAAERPPPLDLFRHLPAIYAARRDEGDPFSLLVQALAEGHAEIEARLALVPEMLDPRTAPAGFDQPRRGFLEYLAGWVALDPEVLGERDPGAAPGPDPRTRVLRHLLEYAAPLQAARGTVRGLRYLLEVLFDADVEILEWRWPAAFRTGVTASLGVDTLLMGEPPLERCVTLVWDAPWLREVLAPLSAGIAAPAGFEPLELRAGEHRLGAVVVTEAAGAEALPAILVERVQRLHAVLKRELPAHIVSFIGYRPPEGPQAAQLQPFIVGVEGFSTLGQVQIQRRS